MSDCDLRTCRYNKDGKCTDTDNRKECPKCPEKVWYI